MPDNPPRPRTRKGMVLCENCDNFASKQLYEAVGWHACAACCFGETAALAEYTDYYKPGEAVYVEPKR